MPHKKDKAQYHEHRMIVECLKALVLPLEPLAVLLYPIDGGYDCRDGKHLKQQEGKDVLHSEGQFILRDCKDYQV